MKFLISEEEKRRILNMHQNATSKQYLSEQAIYNWESGGRKIKYKVQGNKYYTSRDEGKTYTELTKPEDIDWVKKNAIKPENLDKTAKTATGPGPAVTKGQKFTITSPSGNQPKYFSVGNPNVTVSETKFNSMIAIIGSIKFGTDAAYGDYVLMPLTLNVVGKTGKINYIVYCRKGDYIATLIQNFEVSEYNSRRYYLTMSDQVQKYPNSTIGTLGKDGYFGPLFNTYGLSKMNKELADQATSYFCDGGSLRPTWKAQIG